MSQRALFSTSWCNRVKRYLQDKRMRFKEINIEQDPKVAQDLVRKIGQTGVPAAKSPPLGVGTGDSKHYSGTGGARQ